MSISKIASPPAEPIDLAKELGPKGIREILEIMWLAFHDMRGRSISIKGFSEDEITEAWFMFLQERWHSENRATKLNCALCPVLQHPDVKLAKPRGKDPTIDFCFRTWHPDDRYFGAECKNLKEKDSALSQRYIDTGINNYTIGRYGSTTSESAIIGYVLEGNLTNVVKEICDKVKSEKPIQNLLRDMTYDDPHYKSVHLRTLDFQNITIHHLMFSMTA